jgi:ubiquinone/menaquinone biosynthesis C-methylase UbiE
MKRNKKKGLLLGIAIVGVVCAVLYQPLINDLSSQAANPTGFIGSVITRIWSNYFRDLAMWTFSLADLDEQDTILDVGFGGGANIKYIKEHNDDCIVYGIDISDEAVKTAADLNKKYVDSGEVVLSVNDVAYMPFKDEFFGLVVATQTHMYWDELEKGLKECHRVLKHNGTLLLASEIDTLEYFLPEYKDPNVFISLLNTIGYSDVDVKAKYSYVAYICKK